MSTKHEWRGYFRLIYPLIYINQFSERRQMLSASLLTQQQHKVVYLCILRLAGLVVFRIKTTYYTSDSL